MNALETFIAARPFGFVTAADMPELIKLHRLCQCLVRCGACRFTCAAQDVAHLLKCIDAGGDYVRDVAITSTEIDLSPQWRPEPDHAPRSSPSTMWAPGFPRGGAKQPEPLRRLQTFDPADCGGVFDGFGVVSDADPGL